MTIHPPPPGSFQGLVKNPSQAPVPTLTFVSPVPGGPFWGSEGPAGPPREARAPGCTATTVLYAGGVSHGTKRHTGRTLAPAEQPAMRTGLLLINLGTPDAPTTSAVRRYLREFLGDPRVLDIGAVGRAMLLNLIILPTRPAKSAHAYATIWDPKRGSPLLSPSQDLAAAVAAKLGPAWHVELAMRYGSPSLASALDKLAEAEVERIVVLPLFPQYASSSTGTAQARVMELAGPRRHVA